MYQSYHQDQQDEDDIGSKEKQEKASMRNVLDSSPDQFMMFVLFSHSGQYIKLFQPKWSLSVRETSLKHWTNTDHWYSPSDTKWYLKGRRIRMHVRLSLRANVAAYYPKNDRTISRYVFGENTECPGTSLNGLKRCRVVSNSVEHTLGPLGL